MVVFLLAIPVMALFRPRVRGREMIDKKEGYIIVARHRSYWDIPLLAIAFGLRRRIHFIAREGLKKNPVFRPLLRLFSTTINRENFSKSDFRRVLTAIRSERLIGIFPEGTTRSSVAAKAGAIHFARLTKKMLLPVAIKADGPYPPSYPFRFPRITVSIGGAIAVADLESRIAHKDKKPAKQTSQLSQLLMERIDAVG